MLEENDLFVCFLGASVGEAPRIGIWRAGSESNPTELQALTPGTRRMLAAMSLPGEFESRRRLSRRSEEEILAAIARPFQTNASLLDARGVNATARSRGHRIVEDELRRHGLDAGDYFAMTTTGEYSAPRIKADVAEVVLAVREERWEVARHILAVAITPLWRDGPTATSDVGALEVAPQMITDTTAREMIERAVGDAADRAPARSCTDDPEDTKRPPPGPRGVSERVDARPGAGDGPGAERAGSPNPSGRAGVTTRRAAFGLVALVALAVVAFMLARHNPDDAAPDVNAGGPRVALRIYNRVTNGPRGMRDDASPVQLTRLPRPFCKAARCIAGTARTTGQIYEYAICETTGDIPAMTNGNFSTDKVGRADDHNHGLYSSRTYYGVKLNNGVEGYVSDVWVQPGQRAGKLSLPRCPAKFAEG